MSKKPYIIPSKTNNKNMERYLQGKLSEVGEGGGGGGSDPEAIKYTEQTLTAEQQTQARTNIGAGTYSKPQNGIPSSDLADKNKLDLIGTEVVNSVTDIRSGGGDLVGYKITKTYVNSLGRIVTREINLSDLYTRNGVTYVLQALTEQQKTQARGNIGAENIGNKSQSIETDRESESKYPSVKAVVGALGKWGVISQTQTWQTPSGQPRTYTMSDLVYGIIPHSFIVQAENEGATFNETTGYFELNDLSDISYKEMLNIIDANALAHHFLVGGGSIFRSINMDKCPRTICIPNYTGSNTNFSDGFRVATQATGQVSKIETISIGTEQEGRNFTATSLNQFCYGCQHLRKVGFYNGVRMSSASTDVTLIATNCFSLEEFNLLGLAKNINFSTSPALKVSSIAYMVENAANTDAITITLHETAYARCQADTTEYEYNGQTYTGVIAYASAKDITIDASS